MKDFGKFLTVLLCIFMAMGEKVRAGSGDKKVEEKSNNSKVHQSVVYSYSTVTTTEDGGTKVSQLTIATGPDGKYHYVKNENGKKVEGAWSGPLPATPDFDKISQAAMSEISKEIVNPELTNLSSEIDSSIQGYLKKALSSP